jgi:hypothetical protein
MQKLLAILIILIPVFALAQKEQTPTDSFTVKGKVKKELVVTMADLQSVPSKAINDIAISNHLGEVKYTATGLKGVLVKDILNKVEFDTESPKVLSEFYFTLVANDGYKVVFSWNEIFNSPTGDNLYIVTAKEGKELKDMTDRILTVCTTDFKTGRRFVKGLKEIVVQRVP